MICTNKWSSSFYKSHDLTYLIKSNGVFPFLSLISRLEPITFLFLANKLPFTSKYLTLQTLLTASTILIAKCNGVYPSSSYKFIIGFHASK
jgi:hypothetical protein